MLYSLQETNKEEWLREIDSVSSFRIFPNNDRIGNIQKESIRQTDIQFWTTNIGMLTEIQIL